jgi:hypothetical protein
MACRISEVVLDCRDPELWRGSGAKSSTLSCSIARTTARSRSARAKGSEVRSRRSSSVTVMSRREGNPDCTSMSTPPAALRTQSSSAPSADKGNGPEWHCTLAAPLTGSGVREPGESERVDRRDFRSAPTFWQYMQSYIRARCPRR